MKIAALDLGSNTFLCLICEVDRKNGQQNITKIYSDDVEIVRLGQGLSSSKTFHPDALVRAKKTLTFFRTIISQHKPDHILAMATSAARDAENKEDLFQICRELEIPLEIIPGSEEARITYQGSVSGSTDEAFRMVIDIGGGSTEFIFGHGRNLNKGKSFDIGCVRLTEKFIHQQPTPNEQIESCRKFVRNKIIEAQTLAPFAIQEILAVAGTPTTLAAAELGAFLVEKIDGYKMSKVSLENWLAKFQNASIEEKIKFGIPEGRADVILVGVIILLETLDVFKIDHICISTRGVRYGVALELAGRFNS